MGRPSLFARPTVLFVNVEQETKVVLARLAAEAGINLSEYVRDLLKRHLEAQG
jgi:hypothetical protein